MPKRINETDDLKNRLGGIGLPSGGGASSDGPMYDFLFSQAEDLARELTKALKPHQATNSLAQSVEPKITVQGTGYRFQLLMDEYWRFLNDGRKPGKRPPIAPLEKWITAKGIDLGPGDKMKKRKGMAYGIATNIGKNGTKATHFFDKVVDVQWIKEFQDGAQKAFKAQVLFELDNVGKR